MPWDVKTIATCSKNFCLWVRSITVSNLLVWIFTVGMVSTSSCRRIYGCIHNSQVVHPADFHMTIKKSDIRFGWAETRCHQRHPRDQTYFHTFLGKSDGTLERRVPGGNLCSSRKEPECSHFGTRLHRRPPLLGTFFSAYNLAQPLESDSATLD